MALSLCLGCGSDSNRIDAKTNALLRDESARLGGNALAPERTFSDPGGLRDPALFDKRVPTTNPAAERLHFDPASEARNVDERLAAFHALPEEGAMRLDLVGCLRQAQQTAREHLNAEEDYVLAAIQLLSERHLWGPRFFDDVSTTFTRRQTDGDIQSAVNVVNELRATQRLPYGGDVSARLVWQAAENLRQSATGRYMQSSSLIFDASIPLLRGAGLVAQEGLIQAERNLIYAARTFEAFRRSFLVSIARDYFGLVQQQKSIANATEALKSFEDALNRESALFEAGREAQFEVNRAANNVLSARSNLANQRESYILALDRFKIRLGLPVKTAVIVVPAELAVPEPDVTMERATELALEYRLDLQNERDRLVDARRGVRNARNQMLPDARLSGNLTLPTDANSREAGFVYNSDDVSYSAGGTFGLPLDREVERLALRQSVIGLQRSARSFDQFRDNVILEVRSRVRAIEQARFNLTLAEERVRLTERRKEEQDIKADQVTARERQDTVNDLQDAQNARDQARTDLHNSVLDYLVATGQMRVARDGTFLPLPGMENPPKDAKPAAPAEPEKK